jgi:uncharacterized protein YndB with AHSA1/START domain
LREQLSFEVYLRAVPDAVWHALTDPQAVPRWRFGMTIQTDWQPGSALTTVAPDGHGTVKESVPGQRLVYEWTQSAPADANGGHSSTVTFQLAPVGDQITRLTAVHDDLEPDSMFLKVVTGGWPMMLSSLKSLVETGEALAYPRP